MTQKGFTLVELAIALMIIGLLIAGVLKGVELVGNAKVVSVVRDVKAYDTAMIAFKSIYNSLPGDLTNPAARLPNCMSAPCSIGGNGNGIIGVNMAVQTSGTVENNTFWFHLSAASLVSGIVASTQWSTAEAGIGYPKTPLGGNYYMFRYLGSYMTGNYICPFNTTDTTANVRFLDPLVAYQLDAKSDDGLPVTGSTVLYSGSITATVGGQTVYNTSASDTGALCLRIT